LAAAGAKVANRWSTWRLATWCSSWCRPGRRGRGRHWSERVALWQPGTELVVECSSISLEGSAELRASSRRAASKCSRAGLRQCQGHQSRAFVIRLLRAASAFDTALPFCA